VEEKRGEPGGEVIRGTSHDVKGYRETYRGAAPSQRARWDATRVGWVQARTGVPRS
jgi:hypothetical protein